ncbi:MAG: HDIG domain-containing protein [Chloroflexota bacterium]|nr:HDIG domain-containing protein [Chloroflexota bacterium]
MTDYSPYAGHWVTLNETDAVVSVGVTPEETRRAGRQARPKGRLRLVWISPHRPHLPLPEWPLRPLRTLVGQRQIWLAGGAVRDLLLNRPLHDWDFAVAGPARTLTRHIADALGGAYVTLDAERDTARVVIQDPVTHTPITLDFAALRGKSIEEDLLWRDLTINAMALTLDGQLIDPTGGQRDLQAGVVRATSDQTFRDDPARLLRAVRVAGELGFRIEQQTLVDIRTHAASIINVAAERVQAELLRILHLVPAADSLRLAESLGLLTQVLPELSALAGIRQSWPHHYANTFEHSLTAVSATEGLLAALRGLARPVHIKKAIPTPSWAWKLLEATLLPLQVPLLAYLDATLTGGMPRVDLLKWGALLHDIGKAQTRTVDKQTHTHFYGHEQTGAQLARARLTALRFPNKTRHFVVTLVAEHMRLLGLNRTPPPSRRAIYRFYRDAGEAGVGVVLLALADTLAIWGPQLERDYWQRCLMVAETLLQDYFHHQEEVVSPPPLLTGYDLMALGIPEGPDIGRLLAQLREAQAAGEIKTREEAGDFVRAAWGG